MGALNKNIDLSCSISHLESLQAWRGGRESQSEARQSAVQKVVVLPRQRNGAAFLLRPSKLGVAPRVGVASATQVRAL